LLIRKRQVFAMAYFPNPNLADAEGLVHVGGDLRPDRVLEAYRQGIFPWYDEGYPTLWWSPDPRAIFELDQFHIPRRLARTLRTGRFRVTFNRAFSRVIRGCAERESTWINQDMIEVYEELHRLGHAHSVETWQSDELAGGVYGLALGGLFAGESMFTHLRDGSKIALVHLVEHLRQRGYRLFDIQMVTDLTAQFGAVLIPRQDYLRRLRLAMNCQVTFLDKRGS
jgi:leucyl/phenylalanyl-tRNA--protein transferase